MTPDNLMPPADPETSAVVSTPQTTGTSSAPAFAARVLRATGFAAGLVPLLWSAAASAATSDPTRLELPSGRSVVLQEYRDETDTPLAIFRARFVAEGLEPATEELDSVFSDMEHLCNSIALPELRTRGLPAQRIVVSVSSEPLEFGTIAPDVAQFFESYSIDDATCIWELH